LFLCSFPLLKSSLLCSFLFSAPLVLKQMSPSVFFSTVKTSFGSLYLFSQPSLWFSSVFFFLFSFLFSLLFLYFALCLFSFSGNSNNSRPPYFFVRPSPVFRGGQGRDHPYPVQSPRMGRVVGRPLGSCSRGRHRACLLAFSPLVGKWVWVVSVLDLWEREGKGRCRGENLLFPCCASRGRRSTMPFKMTLFCVFFLIFLKRKMNLGSNPKMSYDMQYEYDGYKSHIVQVIRNPSPPPLCNLKKWKFFPLWKPRLEIIDK